MTHSVRVFISHDSKDARFAHRLADDLQGLEVPVWIAPESIRPGESWVAAIERGLGECTHMVIVLTPAALGSQWVRKETEVAITLERQGRMQVIPLDVEPCRVPLLLSSYQMVTFRQDYDAGLRQLASALGLGVTKRGRKRPAPPATMQEVRGPVSVVQREPIEPGLVRIPAGKFLMGSDPKKDELAYTDEQPQHSLYLPDYDIARTPVTNAQYAAFVWATGRRPPGHWEGGQPPGSKGGHPVVYVSWSDALAYCRWLAEVTGKRYGLPSEAEWAKAARGGDGRIYPWGDKWDAALCNSKEGGPGGTSTVGAYPQGASPFGLLDMSGNVWEWTRSHLKPYPYVPDDGREELEAGDDVVRVLRGGAFSFSGRGVRCAYRIWYHPNDWYDFVGFRVVVAPG